MKEKYIAYYPSPLGVIEVAANTKGVTSLYFVQKSASKNKLNDILEKSLKELDEYFSKKRNDFSVPVDMEGTDFQNKVWKELLKIPFGKTVSYLYIAKKIGDENSTRAVGNANGKNPISIIVPCHRVIGANGNLVGYGGGIEKKKWLLEFENSLTQLNLFN